MWDDGTVAAGMRKLGKGMVIDFGMWDSDRFIIDALDWMKIKRVPAEVTGGQVLMRSFVSNNGLYDVWTMWNQDDAPATTDLIFHDGLSPVECTDLNTGQTLPVTAGDAGAKVANISFEPYQTRILLTPRGKLAEAPAEWFWVQRNWWRGTASPGRPMATYKSKLAVNLSDDCAFKILPANFTGAPPEDPSLSDPKLDDTSWPRASLGVFDIPDNVDARHVVFRRRFTVSASWNHGTVSVFGKSELADGGGVRRYMDGKPFGGQIVIDDLGGMLKAGTTHVLTTEVWGDSPPLGPVTPAWITYRPDAPVQQPLTELSFATDYLTYGKPVPLPCHTDVPGGNRCEVIIDPAQTGKNVVLRAQCDNAGIGGIIFNGSFYASYGNIWNFMEVNVTPFVKHGQKNEIVILTGGRTTLEKASLNYYPKTMYP